jgi:hypothetical protein
MHDDPTPFVSPEQMGEGAPDFRSATYSLGATVWFLLGGAVPVVSLDRREKKRAADPDQAMMRFAGLPERVARLLARMLAEDGAARPSDPSALEGQIKSVLSELDQDAMLQPIPLVRPNRAVVPPPEPTTGPPLALKLAATLAAVVVFAAGLALFVASEPFSSRRIDSQARFILNEAGPEVPNRIAAAAEKLRSAGAMNFSVVAPSYQHDGTQIQSVGSSAGQAGVQTSADRGERVPPAEGPKGPIVELATSAKRALRPKDVRPHSSAGGQLKPEEKKLGAPD